MKPLFYTINKNDYGEIAMSEEEFKKILNEVYDAGYEDGKTQATRIYPSTPPIEPTPIPLSDPPYWDWTKKQPEITCNNTNDTSKEDF